MDRDRDLRALERWGLLAGVTGVVANVLLVALYVLDIFARDLFGPGAATWDFGWTGPANDVIGGIVSTAATIPFALALDRFIGRRRVRWVTLATVAALVCLAVSSLLLVAAVVPFERQVLVAIPAVVLMLAWSGVVGWAGMTERTLPRGPARLAFAVGVGGGLGLVMAGVGLAFPAGSPAQYAVGGLGALLGGSAFLAFPLWILGLSHGMRGFLTQGGPDSPETAPPDTTLHTLDPAKSEPVSTRRSP